MIGCVLALSACGTTYPEDLEALRADPMAGVALDGGLLLHANTTEASVGLQKRTFATYVARYRPHEGVTAEGLRDEAVDAAADAGWEMGTLGMSSVEGTKELATGAARININAGVIDGDNVVVIYIEHEFDHPG